MPRYFLVPEARKDLDLTSRPVRFFPVYSYLVVYSANARPIEIVRVLGGAQDVGAILQ
ncbi:MAG: hypothetical protein IPP62_16870 [bacterium]|nr:hypothetical protein [bacterium]